MAGSYNNGTPGYYGDNGPATSALLSAPTALFIGSSHSGSAFYFLDSGNDRVRTFTVGGNISPIAGTGTPGNNGNWGPAQNAEIRGLTGGFASLPQGGVFVDVTDGVVRSIDGNIYAGAVYLAPGSPTSISFAIPLNLQESLTINSIKIAPGFSEFVINSTNGCANGTSGSLCTVALTFTPSQPGIRTAPLLMNYTDGGGTQVMSGALTGYGVGASIGYTPGTISTYTNLTGPTAIASDLAGNLYAALGSRSVVQKCSSGICTQIAGSFGTPGNEPVA